MSLLATLVPKLKYNVKSRHINLRNTEGPYGRVIKIRKTLSALFKYERIELYLPRCVEVRGYAERLITEAIRNGDKHPPTMEMADFWLEDKQMIHKLFKVLAPRYKNDQGTFTEKYYIPIKKYSMEDKYRQNFMQQCVLELKGNPYPPMPQKPRANSASLTNILLREASKEFKKMKLESEKVNC